MSRLMLIHPKPAEARKGAEKLRKAGHTVTVFCPDGPDSLKRLWNKPPDAFVIDLARLPTQQRDLAILLRKRKSTRNTPIVFAADDAVRAERVRKFLPDAEYASWSRIRGVLRRAINRPRGEPVVPGTMDAYSTTPLPKKLGIKAGTTVALLAAPTDFRKDLGKLPPDVTFKSQARGKADLVLLFLGSQAELNRRLSTAARMMTDGGSIWLAWPKQASGIETDLTQAVVRRVGLASGLVDYKICAIDKTWSGLRFARRK